MRDKFSELIEKGIGCFNYVPIAPDMPETDMICKYYNNIWSIPSDTHMHYNRETGERYITGHMVGIKEKWNRFICSSSWGAVEFKNTGFWSLCDFLQQNGLCGKYSILNGDIIYLVTPIEIASDCQVECPSCCVTSESKMPIPLAFLATNGDAIKIRECFQTNSNLYDIAKAMNESLYVKGVNWTVNGENLICPLGNKIYIL